LMATMNTFHERIRDRDQRLFEYVPSGTGPRDRDTLLAVQNAVASVVRDYSYLEIGSHLGGSLQPHLVDTRCRRAYSIDLRTVRQVDDRAPSCVIDYGSDNTTENMINLLNDVPGSEMTKLVCFDVDASQVPASEIQDAPHLAFIDGEHTKQAVQSDFAFVHQVSRSDATILFHDYLIIRPGIREIETHLRTNGVSFRSAKLGGSIYAIFLNPMLPDGDAYLRQLIKANRFYRVKRFIRSVMRAVAGRRSRKNKETP
jgi:hypothetical protein